MSKPGWSRARQKGAEVPVQKVLVIMLRRQRTGKMVVEFFGIDYCFAYVVEVRLAEQNGGLVMKETFQCHGRIKCYCDRARSQDVVDVCVCWDQFQTFGLQGMDHLLFSLGVERRVRLDHHRPILCLSGDTAYHDRNVRCPNVVVCHLGGRWQHNLPGLRYALSAGHSGTTFFRQNGVADCPRVFVLALDRLSLDQNGHARQSCGPARRADQDGRTAAGKRV